MWFFIKIVLFDNKKDYLLYYILFNLLPFKRNFIVNPWYSPWLTPLSIWCTLSPVFMFMYGIHWSQVKFTVCKLHLSLLFPLKLEVQISQVYLSLFIYVCTLSTDNPFGLFNLILLSSRPCLLLNVSFRRSQPVQMEPESTPISTIGVVWLNLPFLI